MKAVPVPPVVKVGCERFQSRFNAAIISRPLSFTVEGRALSGQPLGLVAVLLAAVSDHVVVQILLNLSIAYGKVAGTLQNQ